MIRIFNSSILVLFSVASMQAGALHEKTAVTTALHQKRSKSLLDNDKQAYEYCKRNKHAFVAIVWPIAQGKDQEVHAIFKKYGKIIYKKSYLFNYKSAYRTLKNAHPLIYDFDEHVNWYFPGQTFEKPARIFVLKFDSAQTAIECKMAIRNLFHLQYRAIHVNDYHHEAVDLAKFFFT